MIRISSNFWIFFFLGLKDLVKTFWLHSICFKQIPLRYLSSCQTGFSTASVHTILAMKNATWTVWLIIWFSKRLGSSMSQLCQATSHCKIVHYCYWSVIFTVCTNFNYRGIAAALIVLFSCLHGKGMLRNIGRYIYL